MNESKALKFLQSPWYWVEMTDLQREALRLACRGVLVSDGRKEMGKSKYTYYYHRLAAIKRINKVEGTSITIEVLRLEFINKLESILKGEETNG